MTTAALVYAFVAGLASFLSPCVLPLVPVYVAQLVGPSIWHGESAGDGGADTGTGAGVGSGGPLPRHMRTLLHAAGKPRDKFGVADPGLKDVDQTGPIAELLA